MKIHFKYLIILLFIFPLAAKSTVTDFSSLQRMYYSYMQSKKEMKSFEKSRSGLIQKKYLAYNLYAYHRTANIKDSKEKNRVWSSLHINYLMDVCKSQKNPDDSTCQTFAIAMSNYKDDYKQSYLENKIEKKNKAIEFDFENGLYRLNGVVYSIKSGQKVNRLFKSSDIIKEQKPMICVWANDDKETKTLNLGACPTKNQMCYGFVKCDDNESIKVSCAIENCTEQGSKKCVDDYFTQNKLSAHVYKNCRWVSEKSPEFPRKVIVAPACSLSDANKKIELCSRKVVCQTGSRKTERLATCSAQFCDSTDADAATKCAKEKAGYYSKSYQDMSNQSYKSINAFEKAVQNHQ